MDCPVRQPTFFRELGSYLWERRIWWLPTLLLLLAIVAAVALLAVDRGPVIRL